MFVVLTAGARKPSDLSSGNCCRTRIHGGPEAKPEHEYPHGPENQRRGQPLPGVLDVRQDLIINVSGRI